MPIKNWILRRRVADDIGGITRIGGMGRTFRLYATGRAISVVGDRIALITLVFLVIRLSHGYGPALALFYVARVVPALVLGLLAGVIADQFDRRRLMIGCDLARAALLAIIPSISSFSLGTLFPLVIVLYTLNLLFTTAAAASVPSITPELRLMRGNAILTGIDNAADMAYALGGALVFILGTRLPFYLDAVTFIGSAVTLAAIHIPSPEQRRPFNPREVGTRVREGVAVIRAHPFLKWSTVAFAVAPLAGGAAYVLAPLYASGALSAGPWLFGPLRSGAFRFSLLEVALGLGALSGSAMASRAASKWPRGRLFGAGLVGTGAADILLATTGSIYLALIFMALSGACFSIFIISGMTLSQSITTSEVRGRVVAARATVINAALLSGSALGGAALLVFPVRALWVIEGAIIVLSSLAVWLPAAVRRQP